MQHVQSGQVCKHEAAKHHPAGKAVQGSNSIAQSSRKTAAQTSGSTENAIRISYAGLQQYCMGKPETVCNQHAAVQDKECKGQAALDVQSGPAFTGAASAG